MDNLNFTNVEREHFTDISSIPRVQDVSQPTIHKYTETGSLNLINQTEIERITRYYVPKPLTSSATERPSELEKLRQENKMLKKCIEEKDDLLKGYATKVENLESQVAITWDLTEKLKRVSQENEELTETLKDRLGAFKGTLKQLENLELKLKTANQEKLKFQNLLEEKLRELEESKLDRISLQKLFASKSKEVADLSTQLTETEDKLVISAQENKRMCQSLVTSPVNKREGSIKSFVVASPKNSSSGQKSFSPSPKKSSKSISKTPKASLSPLKESKNSGNSRSSVKIQILRVEKPNREEASPIGVKHKKASSRGSKTPSGVYLKKDFLNISCKTTSSSRAASPKSASFVMSASSKGFVFRDESPKSSMLRSQTTNSFLCASPDSSTRSPAHTPVRISLNEEKKFSQQIAMLAELEEDERKQREAEKPFVPLSRNVSRRETVPVFNHPIKEEDGEDVENTHRDYQEEFKRLVTEINTKVGKMCAENEALDQMVAEKNKDIEKLEEKIAEIGIVEDKITGIIEEKKDLMVLLQQRSQEVNNLKSELTEAKTSQEGIQQYIKERDRKQSLLAQKLSEAEMKMRGLSQVEGQLRMVVNRAQSVLVSDYSKKKTQSMKELEDDSPSAYNLRPLARSTLFDLENERAKTMKDLECISPLLPIEHRNSGGEPLSFIKRGGELTKSQSSLYSETSTQSGPV